MASPRNREIPPDHENFLMGHAQEEDHREIDHINDILDDFNLSIGRQLKVISRIQEKDAVTPDDHRDYANAIKIIKGDLTGIRVGIVRIPEAWRRQQSGVDWVRFIRSRNRTMHEYPAMEYDTIVNQAQNGLPPIIAAVRRRKELLESMGVDRGSNPPGEPQKRPT